LKARDPSSYAIFRLVSPDGDQGYPGKLVTETLIALVDGEGGSQSLGAVAIVYRAKLEDEATVTPVNLTQVSVSSHSLMSSDFSPALGLQSRR